jgi:hypothetical protein
MGGLTITQSNSSFEMSDSMKETIERANEGFKAYTK